MARITRRRRIRGRTGVLLLAALLLCAGGAPAAVIEGAAFPERLELRDAPLRLHRATLFRWMRIFKVYAAALYLPPGADPEHVLDGDVARRLEIQYLRGFSAGQFAESTRVMVRRNVGDAAWARLEPAVEELCRLYRDVEAGDRYALTYLPGRGTELALNGRPLGSVPGAEMGGAVFAIWLGSDPIDAGLRRELLGLE